MKKIMFNDKYGLTDAVLQGRKTMTRRIIPLTDTDKEYLNTAFDWDLRERVIIDRYAKYKIGEVVALAQAYNKFANALPDRIRECLIGFYANSKAWDNKMFVRADLMPHQIRITDIKVERLQDISDEDCMKEGLVKGYLTYGYRCSGVIEAYSNPRNAFAALIDKVSGKGTWESNSFVFAYTFVLVD